MEQSKAMIMHIFEKGSGTAINRCHAMYRVIAQSKGNQAELLRFVIETHGFVESDKSDSTSNEITKMDLEQLKHDYGDMVKGIITSLLNRKYEKEDDLYSELWTIISSTIFRDEKAKVFALYASMMDKRLPFFIFSAGKTMSDKEFVDRQHVIKDKISRAKFIINNQDLLGQLTEVASHLLDIIASEDDPDNRVVLFAYIIDDLQEAKVHSGFSPKVAELLSKLAH